jgi:tetratricopeptide (TPR) repeat protein
MNLLESPFVKEPLGEGKVNMERVSMKAFWEAVEQRLAECSADELRTILRAMAQETLPKERQSFLDQLRPVEEGMPVSHRVLQQEELLADIDDFLHEFQAAMKRADDWEEQYEGGEYDEEDSLGPYTVFVEPLTVLFDQIEATFDYGNLTLARAAYKKLFGVFDLEDDYGRGVRAEDLESMDLEEVRSRYLRAVYETEPLTRRPHVLLEQMQQAQSWSYRPRPRLEDVIQISPKPLPDQDRFFPDWITFLRKQTSRDADTWLREAIRLSQGTLGLEELARAEGKQRPRAYLDWFAALNGEGKHQEILTASQEALQTLPDQLPIRAAVADCLCAAATRLNEAEALRAGRWEAFVAKPTLVRLLDLWDAASTREARTGQMQQAAQRVKDYLAHAPRRFMEAWEDGLERPAWSDKSVLVHACLLAEDWNGAHQLAAEEQVLGWSGSGNTQGLVVSCFLVGMAGKLPGELPPNLIQLWQWGLQNSIGFAFVGGIDQTTASLVPRLERIYSECLPTVLLSRDKKEEFLFWCLEVAKLRVNAIVSNQHRGSYDKAAVLIAGCAEMLRLWGRDQEAEAMLEDVSRGFPRHRAFQAELKRAVQRMGSSLQ